MNITLATNIKTNYNGFNYLIELYYQTQKTNDSVIYFDFSDTNWFEANLSAILGAIVELCEYDGKTTSFINLKPKIKDILHRNSFLPDYRRTLAINKYNTIVPYKKFEPYSDTDFMNYVKSELLAKPDFPKHNKQLGKKINESIFELYENARTHGRCKQIHTCGQYYPNNTPKRLDFTIVDMGRTIKDNVNEFLKKDLKGYKTIEWALAYGTTTKTGNISGGLGLNIIFEFIKHNQGKIQIISSDGYWEYNKGKAKTYSFESNFPGTIVNIEFNLDDPNIYKLKEEVSRDNIF